MLHFQQVIENKLAHIFFSGTVMSKCNKCEYEVSKKNNLREHIRKYHEQLKFGNMDKRKYWKKHQMK